MIGLSRLVEQTRQSVQKTLALVEQLRRKPVDEGADAGTFAARAFD